MGVSPSILRGRAGRVTLVYGDPQFPERVTSHVHEPDWTVEDQVLLLGLGAWEASLCPGCGHPREHAWHDMLTDDWVGTGIVCHACTARDGQEQAYQLVVLNPDIPPAYLASVTPLEVGVNTTEPTITKP